MFFMIIAELARTGVSAACRAESSPWPGTRWKKKEIRGKKEREGEKKASRKRKRNWILFFSLPSALRCSRISEENADVDRKEKRAREKEPAVRTTIPNEGRALSWRKRGLRRVCPRSISTDLASLPSPPFLVSTLYTFRRYVHFVS